MPSQAETTGYEPLHLQRQEGKASPITPTSLAAEIGRGAARMLSQLTYWINRSHNLFEGRYWIYKTAAEMAEEWFPDYSVSAIRNHLAILKDAGLVESAQFQRNRYNHCNYYALTEKGAAVLATHGIKLRRELWETLPRELCTPALLFEPEGEGAKTGRSDSQKLTHRSDKNSHIELSKNGKSNSQKLVNQIKEESKNPDQRIHPIDHDEDESDWLEKQSLSDALERSCERGTQKKLRQAAQVLERLKAKPEHIGIVVEYLNTQTHYGRAGKKPHPSQLARAYTAAMNWHRENSPEVRTARRNIRYADLTDMDVTDDLDLLAQVEREIGLPAALQDTFDQIRNYAGKNPHRRAHGGAINVEQMPAYAFPLFRKNIETLVYLEYLAPTSAHTFEILRGEG